MRRTGAGLGLLMLGLPMLGAGCLSVEDVQTPNGSFSRGGSASDETPDAASDDAEASSACGASGWTLLRVSGRDQMSTWTAPSMTQGCGAAPHRLSAAAPTLGAAFELQISPSTGRVVEATYTTTDLGADGEAWGEYSAFVDVTVLRFGGATATEQPFELAGNILGPFGPVSLEVGGCARLRRSLC